MSLSPAPVPARPLVAVRYGPPFVPALQLVAAAADVCDLLWLVDGGLPEVAGITELLARFGPVLDVADIGPGGLRAAVAAYRPDGLVTYVDAGMVDLAGVAADLGLPFHGPATAVALVDKVAQRATLRAAGIPGPACVAVPDGPADAAVAAVADSVAWPAVVKARSAQGSRTTTLAATPAAAVAFIDGLGPQRLPLVLEGYLASDPSRPDGPFADYVSVESLVAAGAVSHVAVTGRFPPAANFRETGFFIPALLEPGDEKAVLALADAAIDALGVRWGCLHTEIKLTPDGPRIIEVNGRMGGGISEILERAAGIPLLALTLQMALGAEVRVDGPVRGERIGYRFFLQPPARTAVVEEIDGLDVLTAHPGVDTVSVHRGPGAALDWREGSRLHILAVVGAADTYDELCAVERMLQRDVTVTYAERAVE